MANQFLIKDTMQDMRNLSAVEIDGLNGNNPIYAGVKLLGYYEKGDTPAPIIYYLAPIVPDPGPDDGGSVIIVNSTKLIHNFVGHINVRYFGAKANREEGSKIFINRCLQYCQKHGNYAWIDENSVYLIEVSNNHLGGIEIPSNTTIIIDGEVTCQPNNFGNYCIINVAGQDNVNIIGKGKVRGSKYKHLSKDMSKILKERKRNTQYNLGDRLYVTSTEVEVVVAGISSNILVNYNDNNVGDEVFDNTVKYKVIAKGIGEWGIGIRAYEATNLKIEGVEIVECWGDGIYIGGREALTPDGIKPCKDISIKNVHCLDNRRQGMTLANIDGFYCFQSSFNDTSGTGPNCGIDIEPNVSKPTDPKQYSGVARNIVLDSCTMARNQSKGLNIYSELEQTTFPISNLSNIVVKNCLFEENFEANLTQLSGTGLQLIGCKFLNSPEYLKISNISVNTSGTLIDGCDIITDKPVFSGNMDGSSLLLRFGKGEFTMKNCRVFHEYGRNINSANANIQTLYLLNNEFYAASAFMSLSDSTHGSNSSYVIKNNSFKMADFILHSAGALISKLEFKHNLVEFIPVENRTSRLIEFREFFKNKDIGYNTFDLNEQKTTATALINIRYLAGVSNFMGNRFERVSPDTTTNTVQFTNAGNAMSELSNLNIVRNTIVGALKGIIYYFYNPIRTNYDMADNTVFSLVSDNITLAANSLSNIPTGSFKGILRGNNLSAGIGSVLYPPINENVFSPSSNYINGA